METLTVKNLAIRTWLGNMEANLLRNSLESKLIEHKICDKMRGGGGGATTKRQRTSCDFPCGMIFCVVAVLHHPPPPNFRRDVRKNGSKFGIPKKH